MNIDAVENSAAGDSIEAVLRLTANADYYTIGSPSSATLRILDNDTAPTAPQNLSATPGNGTAMLAWDHPTSYDEVATANYQYRHNNGTGTWTGWAGVPGGDAETTSHTVTGLTNDLAYLFEVRAINANHNGAAASVAVTPIAGVAVSFAAAALSVDEGDTVTVTVTLAEAPAAGTTVTVPIVATGSGLIVVVPVPTQAIFAAGETSKDFVMHTFQDTFDDA